MPPVRLTDAELDAVLAAARPLAVGDRDAFLQQVADALKGRAIGPGAVFQVCRELQREFFDPPVIDHVRGGRLKYR